MSKKPIDTEEFWEKRIRTARKKQYSVYVCNDDLWEMILQEHLAILKKQIPETEKVLDAGCGYGRMAKYYNTDKYTGVDFSKKFIEIARLENPGYTFTRAKLEKLPFKDKQFDTAFCISIRDMIIGNMGNEAWYAMATELKRVAKRVLILEYTSPSKYWIL